MQAYDDPESEPLELGASIFVSVNYVLMNATDEFGLQTTDFSESSTIEPEIGLRMANQRLLQRQY